MRNADREKHYNYAVVTAAIALALSIIIAGLAIGLTFALKKRHESNAGGNASAQYLLVDSAYELRRTTSAIRLCKEAEPFDSLNRLALIAAVRAEAALECRNDDWADVRGKEQFLNDIATILHTYTPERTMAMSDSLYEYADKFYVSVTEDGEFDYNGELIPDNSAEDDTPLSPEDIEKARELVNGALKTDRTEYVGAWNGHAEFYIERDGKSGYAVVCGDKINEFAFSRDDSGEQTDVAEAETVALKTAEACGYGTLTVKWSEKTGKSVTVIMCRSYDGALASDDCATAIVYGGTTVAFTAGGCDHEHKDIPSPKVGERAAHRAAIGSDGDGVLVVRTVNGKERICYEYRYTLEDGVHYVYVCAETGKQMEVK